MIAPLHRLLRIGMLLFAASGPLVSPAQVTVPEPAHVELPATGTGPLLVLLTGADGAANHLEQTKAFGREGWVVAVVDSNRALPGSAEPMRALLKQLLARPEVRSTKAALVGYSLGGWLVLAVGNRLPDLVSAAVAYYPSTFRAGEPKAFLASPAVGVPTLILAGVRDTYMNCCTIERARALVAAAAELRAPVQLIEFQEADHGFVLPAYPPVYRPDDAAEALRRAVEHLRRHATAG